MRVRVKNESLATLALCGIVWLLLAGCSVGGPGAEVASGRAADPTATPLSVVRPTPMPTAPEPTAPASPTARSATATPGLPAPLSGRQGWRKRFADEFDGAALDTGKWNTELPWGRVNPPELQYYMPDALELRDGMLRIKVEKRQTQGYDYSSGVIASFGRFDFTYGYAEIRARIPTGKGLWPTFWLLSDDRKSFAEVDVMEFRGNESQRVNMVLHYDGPGGTHELIQGAWASPEIPNGFHTYAVEWRPSTMIWYGDGFERYRLTEHVPDRPMFLVANLAVGGWATDPDFTTIFPAYFDIDYIRVYQPE